MNKLTYQVRNWRAHWRSIYLGSYITIENKVANAISRSLGSPGNVFGRWTALGTLDAKLIKGNGKVIDLGCVGHRVVTTAGVNYMRDDFAAALALRTSRTSSIMPVAQEPLLKPLPILHL